MYGAGAALMRSRNIPPTYETTTPTGSVMFRTRPEVALANDAWRRATVMLQQFGLTPASRPKVDARPPDVPGSRWAGLLGKRDSVAAFQAKRARYHRSQGGPHDERAHAHDGSHARGRSEGARTRWFNRPSIRQGAREVAASAVTLGGPGAARCYGRRGRWFGHSPETGDGCL